MLKPGLPDSSIQKRNDNGAEQGVPPLRAASGARVNADVGIKREII